MKSFNTYYINKEQLGSFIHDKKIHNSSSLLIQVYSAVVDKAFISTLLSELIHFLPDAIIIGATTDGEIMDGYVSSGKVVLSFSQFENTTLKAASVEHQVDGYYSGQYLAKTLITDDTKLFIAFTDGLHTNGEEFLNGIASINDKVVVAGGHAGDNSCFTQTYVFTKEHIFSKGAVGVTLNSKQLHVHTDYSFNWHPIGNELTITKAEGNRVYTIDGKSAVDTYAYYLGEDIAKGLPGIGVEFPLIVNRNGSTISRACIAKEDDGSLIVGGNLYPGEKVRIGYGNAKEILRKSQMILNSTAKMPSESIFIYSCMTRRHFMGEEIESEVLPLQQVSPVSGFFTYGEFFSTDQKNLFNQTMTLVSLSENDQVQKPILHSQAQQVNINTTSIEALIHLINITSKEVQEQTRALQQSYQTNQELKERMELALMGSNDGVWDWNILDNSVYFSPRWKEIIGYSDNELPNEVSTWNDRIHPDDVEKAWADVYKNVNGETEYYENIHRLQHKDGHWVWIHDRGKVQFDADGKAVRMIGTHTDITEQKENELRLSHQAQMIQQTHEAINTTDLQGYINEWNKGSELLFGYKAEEILGKHISLLFPDDTYGTLVTHIPELMEKEEYRTTLALMKKSHEKVLVDLSLSLLKDTYGSNIGIVGYLRDITKRKKTEEALHYQAHHDALTALPNRVLFMDRLEQGIQKAKRHNEGLAVFFIDLDKFKHINDSLGHSIGDKVLKIIAKRLQDIIRKEDTLARLSGDEFTIIMEDLRHPEDASLLGEKILKTLAEGIVINKQRLYVSGSVGISFYPQDATDAQSLLKYADTAMYRAKEEGRNNYQFYAPEMTELALKRILMQTSLRQAIDNEEFIIYYQPQIKASTNALIGVEVLIRWEHPVIGVLMPDEFIPLAEESGMIAEIDQWVMKTAMGQISQWYKEGLNPGVLGLNISIIQLDKINFLQQIEACLQRNDFDPAWLELEITESQMMKRPEEVITKLHQINALGIGISIDDFGTGYSSLSLLKRLPINRLKIDRSFVRDIPNDEEDVAIVTAIIALAKSLKLDLIAEGVETSEQIEFLIDHECINIQGHYFSHPLTVEEMHAMLLKHQE
ncbi:EAL domain-containing protein [Sulfurovum sp. XGS-02]|uniref:bifunctional diguanylate cyclase/phosphodiesterase n=1 Tax=Sulfurovum sp. XGS-02 TaxID=2925411 RepID=UPI0020482E69|nr:EAL domain-containing protein [Sulfurovum sp. XGS-02]UPT77458.1 EAL domain-containing protein [Sulfurovum sp. XGS-02]